jgi:hypothetical protein
MNLRSVALALSLSVAMLCGGAVAQTQNHHALVVGIDDYRNVAKLSRAVADARAMSGALQSLGFKTRLVENPDRNAMSIALAGFEEGIEKGDTAFVFFAGHGIEIAGQNVLLPADVPDPGRASSGILRDAGFNTATLIERITARGARSAFFVFDACRDNPYAQSGNTRAVGSARGLARTEAPEGVFVLMSAGLNQQALDSLSEPGKPGTDSDPNSVFTRVLLEEMARPGLTHIVLAKAVQTRVRDLARSVNHAQVPAFYDQIIGDVVLRPDGALPPPPPVASLPPASAPPAAQAPFDLGTRWVVREVSDDGRVFDGTWTRSGPRSFSAQWRDTVTGETISDAIEFESQTGNAIVLFRQGLKGRYFGTLSPDGRIVQGSASWYPPGARWSAEILTDAGSPERPNEPKVAAVTPFDLGKSWEVQERSANGNVYKGVWTRSGPRSFKAQWRDPVSGATIVDTIEFESRNGNAVVLFRQGLKGRYFGTLSPDGRSIQGGASWYGKDDRWSAEIR